SNRRPKTVLKKAVRSCLPPHGQWNGIRSPISLILGGGVRWPNKKKLYSTSNAAAMATGRRSHAAHRTLPLLRATIGIGVGITGAAPASLSPLPETSAAGAACGLSPARFERRYRHHWMTAYRLRPAAMGTQRQASQGIYPMHMPTSNSL